MQNLYSYFDDKSVNFLQQHQKKSNRVEKAKKFFS